MNRGEATEALLSALEGAEDRIARLPFANAKAELSLGGGWTLLWQRKQKVWGFAARGPNTETLLADAPSSVRVAVAHKLADLVTAMRVQHDADVEAIETATRIAAEFLT